MSARKKIADLLWWSMPSSTDEEAKERTSEMLDAFAAEERADERAKTLNEAADVTWERALSAPTTGQRTGLMYVTFALRELAAAGQAPASQPETAPDAEVAHVVDYEAAEDAEPECVDDCPGCETAPDFYQPGHTYAGKHGRKFRVDTITTHPEDGERTALGWRFWNDTWEPYAYGEGDWEIQQLNGHTDVIASAETPGAES